MMSDVNIEEYQSDADPIETIEIVERDYVADSRNIIYAHDDINIENALQLNQQFQSHLKILRSKLEQLLDDCQAKYKKNEDILKEISNNAVPAVAARARCTYYYCGYPYFKNRMAFPAPPPADYMQRRFQHKELFPLHLEDCRAFWTARDKFQLIQAVKKQILKYLDVKSKDRVRRILASGSTKAESEIAKVRKENTKMSGRHLVDLFEAAKGYDFEIDWFSISASDLDTRHSANGCMGMWYGYLMPTLNRKEWTSAEEDELLNIVNKYSAQNWNGIAEHISGRSGYQCLVHYHTVLSDKNYIKNSRWTKEEDDRLIDMVERYRIGTIIPWTKILEQMPGRYKAQVYNRYMFSLNPEITRSKFTVEEDCILMAAIKEYGTNFQNFPQNLLPGRNVLQIRNRYNNVLKFVGKSQHWTAEHDEQLVNLVEKHGNTNWVKIAEEIKVHSRLSCRSRYTTIVKFLQKNPQCTVEDVPRRKKAFSSKVTTENWMETIIKEKQKEQFGDEAAIALASEREERKLVALTNNDLGLEYYQYFKYSYDFRFGERKVVPNSTKYEYLRAVDVFLDAKLDFEHRLHERTFSDYMNLQKLSKIKLEKEYLNFIVNCSKNGFTFPPNYRNVLGLRGLVIMFECKEQLPSAVDRFQKVEADKKSLPDKKQRLIIKKEEAGASTSEEPTTTIPRQTPEEAIQLFKKRFKVLFQKVAALAQISPQGQMQSLFRPLGQEPETETEPEPSPPVFISPPRRRKRPTEPCSSDSEPQMTVPSVTGEKKRRFRENRPMRVENYTVETETGIFRITVHDDVGGASGSQEYNDEGSDVVLVEDKEDQVDTTNLKVEGRRKRRKVD